MMNQETGAGVQGGANDGSYYDEQGIERLGSPPTREPRSVPEWVRDLLGPPPVLPGESLARYEALLLGFARSLKPKDEVEWFEVRDATDAEWEAQRLKRGKQDALTIKVTLALHPKVKAYFAGRGGSAAGVRARTDQWLRRWAAGKRAMPEIPGLDIPLETARLLRDNRDVFGALDAAIAQSVRRRQGATHQIERRRLARARLWRLERVFARGTVFH
jgi:hypothetical protein